MKALLIKNLEKLKSVIDRTGCKILLAQKGFSMFSVYPLMGQYLNGVTSSSVQKQDLALKKWAKKFIPMPLLFRKLSLMKFCRIQIILSLIHFNNGINLKTK